MISEIRHAARRLRATPIVTLSAIACLSIGVWMTCIMSAIALAWFRPDLRIPDPDRVVQMDERGLYNANFWQGRDCCHRIVSAAVYDSISRLPLFAAIGQYEHFNTGIQGDDKTTPVTRLTSGMMGVFRIRPALGRLLLPSDDTTGAVAILSYQLWQRRYGGDSGIVGRFIRLRGEDVPRRIIGVMPDGFVFPREDEPAGLYTPFDVLSVYYRAYTARRMLARLADGVDVDHAQDVVRSIAAHRVGADRDEAERVDRERAERAQRAGRRAWTPPPIARGGVIVMLEHYVGEPIEPDIIRMMVLILACGLTVALIAAANVINLLLVRGASRRQEIAVRMALGASRSTVVRELVIESILLSLPAMAIGLAAAAAQWSQLDPAFFLRHMLGEIDWRIAVVSACSALLLASLAGVWPGIRATAISLDQVLRDSRRSGVTGSPLDGLLGRIVVASTSATVMLLICAVLLGLSARDSVEAANPSSNQVLTSDLTMDGGLARDERVALARATLAKLRALPGVATAALGQSSGMVAIMASPTGEPEGRMGSAEFHSVSDGYFATLGIRFLMGHEFGVRETRDSSPAVIINRAFAQKLFPGQSASGKAFRFRRLDDSTVSEVLVAGVLENDRGAAGNMLQIYFPYGSMPSGSTTAWVRYRRQVLPHPADIATALRGDRRLASTTVTTLADRRDRKNPVQHYIRFGFALFAVVGLILAMVGTYGVVAYSVVRRTHELGVRLALGADAARVVRMVVDHGLRITLTGIAIGAVLSIGVMRFLGAYVEDVNMGYPAAIGGVIAFVCVLSVVASVLPAIRAGRLNPVDALRAD
jgi:putative ABC transport system permease protein